MKVNNITIGEGIPKVCVPIVGTEEESIMTSAYEIADSACDLVEWRGDWFKNIRNTDATVSVLERLRGILNITPIIFTIRTKNEGGQLNITFEEYSNILLEVAKSGLVEIIDVECYFDERTKQLIAQIQEEGVRVIGSNHNFEKTQDSEKLCDILRDMDKMGADIPKLAVMPQNRDDVVRLLMVTSMMAKEINKPIVTMSMGKLGAISRVSGATFGSAITFGMVGNASAPGQLDCGVLKKIMKLI